MLCIPASGESAQVWGTAIGLTLGGGWVEFELEKDGEKRPLSGRNWNSGRATTVTISPSRVYIRDPGKLRYTLRTDMFAHQRYLNFGVTIRAFDGWQKYWRLCWCRHGCSHSSNCNFLLEALSRASFEHDAGYIAIERAGEGEVGIWFKSSNCPSIGAEYELPWAQ